jgi:hypothetical protein
MAYRAGSLTIDDLLTVQHQSAADFGIDTIQEVLEADINAHNQIVTELVMGMAEVTTDRQRIYGASQDGEMIETDETGRAPTQPVTHGDSVGFPLRQFQYSLGWNSTFFRLSTPQDMAKAVLGAQKAHLKQVETQIKYALFRAANYTYKDFLVDRINLSVKRLVNADSMVIPEGPNGEVYDASTHSHYNANATLTDAAGLALIDDVVEHGHGNKLVVCISKTDEAAFRALTSFTPYVDSRLITDTANTYGRATLDQTRIDNRAIGVYGAAELWVKPWVPANYAACWDMSDTNKPLAYRQRDSTSMQGLAIVAENSSFPLHSQMMQVEFGVGVWTRTNGAILQFNNASYSNPF